MPVWLIVAILAAWIAVPVIVAGIGIWQAVRDDRRERETVGADVIVLPTGYAGCEPSPHAGIDGLRQALDAAARSPRSEPLSVEPCLPRDRPGPGLRA